MMNKLNKSRISLIISMIIFGSIGVFVKNIELRSSEIALYRAIIAVLLIGLLLFATKQKISFCKIKKEIPFLLLSGFAMGFNWILLFQSYKYTTVSVATLSYYFAPVIVILACPFLFKEKMSIKQWICFIMSSLGIVIITGIGDLNKGSNHIVGIAFGLGAAVLYASVILLNKYIKNVTGIHRTFLQFVAAAAVLLPYVLLTGGIHIGELSTKSFFLLMIVGVVHSGIAYCLYFSSLGKLSGQKTAMLSYIDPLVAVIASVAILGEPITIPQILGGVLI